MLQSLSLGSSLVAWQLRIWYCHCWGSLSPLRLIVFAVIQVGSLAWELLHAVGTAKKKKKKKKTKTKNPQPASLVIYMFLKGIYERDSVGWGEVDQFNDTISPPYPKA